MPNWIITGKPLWFAGRGSRSPAGRGGVQASAALPLLDDITTSSRSAGKTVNLSGAHWYQKVFRNAHVKMELDPEVWSVVETIILHELRPPAIVRGP